MKQEYDFTNAKQGKFYRPIEELDIPIYLESDLKTKYTKITFPQRAILKLQQ